jgi:transcriptional regulator with XRE-family HTH domain
MVESDTDPSLRGSVIVFRAFCAIISNSVSGNQYKSDQRHQLCESARAVRRQMNVSQRQFARLMGVNARTICNWEARLFAPTLAKRFRLEQLRCLVESIDMRDRSGPVEFANEPGWYNKSGHPRQRQRTHIVNLLALGMGDAE